MRTFLISLGTFVALLIAAVLVGPSFVDWNAQKALITEEARKVTGRTLVVDGDVSLVLLPSPALSAEAAPPVGETSALVSHNAAIDSPQIAAMPAPASATMASVITQSCQRGASIGGHGTPNLCANHAG